MFESLKARGKKRTAIIAGAIALSVLAPVGIASANAATTGTQAKVVGSKTDRCSLQAKSSYGKATIKVTKYSDGSRYVRVDWTGATNFIMESRTDSGDRRLKSSPHYIKVDGREPKNVWSRTSYGYWTSGAKKHSVYATWRMDDTAYANRYWYDKCQTKAFTY